VQPSTPRGPDQVNVIFFFFTEASFLPCVNLPGSYPHKSVLFGI
jgi:hypothetical protein